MTNRYKIKCGLPVSSKSGSYTIDCVLKRCPCEMDRGMWYAPHRFQWGWIIRQSRNHMPMDVGELIP